MFTQDELAELVAADAEIEESFRLTKQDIDLSRELDKVAKYESMPPERRKVAAQQKAWYEANREKVAAQKKAYREANREKVAAQQKAYREANREKYNSYMREYMRNYRNQGEVK